jgi:hypothetical protein
LPGDRYRIAFGDKDETVPALAGLRVAEYLLKQPGRPARSLDINRALCEGSPRAIVLEDALARSGEQTKLDGFSVDEWQSPDPCSDEHLEEARELVNSLDHQAAKAREGGEHDKADGLEHQADVARGWIRDEEARRARWRGGQPDQDSQAEQVRIKLTANYKNACKALRKRFNLAEFAAHLEAQISSGTNWKYNPVPGVEWEFNLDRR